MNGSTANNTSGKVKAGLALRLNARAAITTVEVAANSASTSTR